MANSIIGMAFTPTRNSYRDLKEIQQAQQKEHRKNNVKTALGISAAIALPTSLFLLTKNTKKPIELKINLNEKTINTDKITTDAAQSIKNTINKLKNIINQENIDYTKIKSKIDDLLKNPNKLKQKIEDFINNSKISTASKKSKLDDMLKNPHNVIDEVSRSAKKAAKKLKDAKQKLNVNIDAKTIQKKGLISKLKTYVGGAIKKAKGTKAYKIASKTVKDFMSKTPAQKGKIGLVAAGIALTASVIIRLIRNHNYNAGKIDQKYEDMKNNYPIIDAETGDVISKKDYEKMVNTYLK